jgi:hypothetical protein
MADIVFNIAKGKIAYYGGLPAAADALIAVPIQTAGIVSDAIMRDYADLGTLLAGASDEQTTLGRKTLTGVTVTVDNTGDKVVVDADDVTWAAAAGNAISAVVICYDNDTGAGTDANIVPMVKLDCAVTPDGTDFTMQFAAAGIVTAS